MLMEAETWVAVAFVIFLAVLAWLGVFRKLLDALDKRSAAIRNELDEARKLKEEAQAVLGQFQKKRGEAEREAEENVTAARAEAAGAGAGGSADGPRARAEAFAARRTKMAEQKIAQAETQALADVKAAAAEAAVAAAEKILAQTVTGKTADDLISQGISDVK